MGWADAASNKNPGAEKNSHWLHAQSERLKFLVLDIASTGVSIAGHRSHSTPEPLRGWSGSILEPTTHRLWLVIFSVAAVFLGNNRFLTYKKKSKFSWCILTVPMRLLRFGILEPWTTQKSNLCVLKWIPQKSSKVRCLKRWKACWMWRASQLQELGFRKTIQNAKGRSTLDYHGRWPPTLAMKAMGIFQISNPSCHSKVIRLGHWYSDFRLAHFRETCMMQPGCADLWAVHASKMTCFGQSSDIKRCSTVKGLKSPRQNAVFGATQRTRRCVIACSQLPGTRRTVPCQVA